MTKRKHLPAVARLVLALFLVSGSTGAVSQQHPTVVVELFTSESCSSCPPADALLSQLSQARAFAGTELVLLSEHVDYWNNTGWNDRFSLPPLSERQNTYETALHLEGRYTPQFVVDGRIDAPGNDPERLRRSIAQAAQMQKPARITIAYTDADHARITVQDAETVPAQVVLAITEDDLTTRVTHGENGGRTLRNSAVVREFKSLGHTTNGSFEGSVRLQRDAAWQSGKLHLVILVQRNHDLAIIGATSAAYQ